MGYGIKLQQGSLVLEDNTQTFIEQCLQKISKATDVAEIKRLAYELVPPIQIIVNYNNWGGRLLNSNFSSSLDKPNLSICNLDISWDNVNIDMITKKVQDVGEELARQQNTKVQDILDAVIMANGQMFSSPVLTKEVIDNILKKAIDVNLPIKTVIVNIDTLIDGWGCSLARPNFSLNDFCGNYGGADWYTFSNFPTNEVYFCTNPVTVGFWEDDSLRVEFDFNIRTRTSRYRYSQNFEVGITNPAGIWKLSIV